MNDYTDDIQRIWNTIIELDGGIPSYAGTMALDALEDAGTYLELDDPRGVFRSLTDAIDALNGDQKFLDAGTARAVWELGGRIASNS